MQWILALAFGAFCTGYMKRHRFAPLKSRKITCVLRVPVCRRAVAGGVAHTSHARFAGTSGTRRSSVLPHAARPSCPGQAAAPVLSPRGRFCRTAKRREEDPAYRGAYREVSRPTSGLDRGHA